MCFPIADYLIKYHSYFPQQLLFALVPPTNILGGWATFVVAIMFIGILTALIGDLANSFGCSAGLNADVTAITFVALGTSLPGMLINTGCNVYQCVYL